MNVFKNSIDYIKFNDNLIEYNKNFKLYLTTRLKNPNYLPETSSKVKLVNFLITPTGLDDQLLGIVTRKEIPELERSRDELIMQSISNKKKLKDIEEKILNELSSSRGDLLDDESAIEILSSSRSFAIEIDQKQEKIFQTESEINSARLAYHEIASKCSVLFFTISDLSHIDPMYQYSLEWFIQLFEQVRN